MLSVYINRNVIRANWVSYFDERQKNQLAKQWFLTLNFATKRTTNNSSQKLKWGVGYQARLKFQSFIKQINNKKREFVSVKKS